VSQDEDHPVTAGLVALVAVALAIGLLLGLVSLLGSRVLGLGGSGEDRASGDGGPSLYLPAPRATGSSVPAAEDSPTGASASESPARPRKRTRPITLRAGSAAVAAMARIDLTGAYRGGDGTVLQVQRKGDGGAWEDFPVTATVSGGTFATYVQTGRSGEQRFRVRDAATGRTSNAVTVTVG
jgi:hypothetical protein